MKKNLLYAIVITTALTTYGAAAEISEHKVDMKEARAAALQVYSGKVESAELENEHGMSVYSFDIRRGKHGLVHEIQIAENTGKVVSNTTETRKQEADEKAADQGKK
jgi:uncharacterized membrane protein YkoI